MTYTKKTAQKWYRALGFPKEMDAPFERALSRTPIDANASIETFTPDEGDGARSLLYYLYFCEALAEKYAERGIPEGILLDTLSDVVVWTKTWSALKGELYLGETGWLRRHLEMRLFKLGRLQFCIAPSEHAIPEKGLAVGETVVEVHIPEGEPLQSDACRASFDAARDFFARYYPSLDYSLFTCHSWLLDASLGALLPEGSNILKFARFFTVVQNDPSDALLGYLFRWGAKREDIHTLPVTSSFAARVKAAVLEGRTFYESLGYIEK